MALLNIFKPRKAETKKTLTEDFAPATVTAAGAYVGQRTLVSPAWSKDYTPASIAKILEAAERGDQHAIAEFFALADKVIERDMHINGVVGSLVTAVAGLPHKAKAKDKSKRAQKNADEFQALMHRAGPLRKITAGLIAGGLFHGLGVAAIQYDLKADLWTPVKFTLKPAHFFTFDRTDMMTPLLISETAGQPAMPIERGTALVFTPTRFSAIQIKNSLAWVLCWAWVIKSIVFSDWALFIQTFGHPMVTGKYKNGANPDDIGALRAAVNAINSTFRGVFRDDLEVEFKEIARSNTDIFEKVCRYLDEGISKVALASTLATDTGPNASRALGEVQSEGKYDLVRSIANQYSATLQEAADFYFEVNYGPDSPVPEIVIDVEEAEDLVALSTIIKNLSDAGVPLVAEEIRGRFGFREPQDGDELIGGPAATPAPVQDPNADPATADANKQSAKV